MKKGEKITLKYKNDPPGESLFSSIRAADENDLRLLLALALLDGNVELSELPSRLDMSAEELSASVKYWCGAGLLGKGRSSAKRDNAGKSGPEAAHREGKLERRSEMPEYSSAELAALIESRRVTAEFIDEAQRVMGKIFNTHDVNILVGMIDYIGFDEKSVILILAYVKQLGKTLRYAEKTAFALYDEGITDAAGLEKKFRRLEENAKTEGQVKAMFGMVGRDLTAKEKKFLRSWIDGMGYDTECIRLAYDITVDKTHEPLPAYANSILEAWYADGLLTYEQITASLEEKKQKSKKKATSEKSFDTDEFFAAALKRSFEEL